MNRDAARSALARLPFGLLGALVLIVSVERYVARNPLQFLSQDGWEWRLSREAARRGSLGSEILAFGSSAMRLGVVPDVLQQATGRPAYNLAVCAGMPASSWVLLEQALAHGAKPRIVIVEFHPLALTRPARHAMGYWPELVGSTEAACLAWLERDTELWLRVTLMHALPSLENRRGLQKRVVDGFVQPLNAPEESNAALRRNVARNRGALLVDGSAETTAGRDEPVTPILETSVRHVRAFLELAALRNCPVLWVLPPVREDLQATREASGLTQAVRDLARSLQRECANLTVVDGTRIPLETKEFLDADHLNRHGALRWSAALGPIVARLIDGKAVAARFVTLNIADFPPVSPEQLARTEDFATSMGRMRAIAASTASTVRR